MAQISRLKEAEISNGNIINADDLESEFDQLLGESNSQDNRITMLESGTYTFTGNKTFASPIVIPAPTSGSHAARKADIDAQRIPTGVLFDYFGVNLPSGWLLADGKTIGNISSNATARANADTQNLFELLWSALPDGVLILQDNSGSAVGRGGSAISDFNASRRLGLPDLRGRASVGLDNMGSISANRLTTASLNGANANLFGGTGGLETHTLFINEIPSHTHTYQNMVGGGTAPVAQAASGIGLSSDLKTSDATGGGLPHSNTQPWLALNKMIKL
jgi:hypothetical protein